MTLVPPLTSACLGLLLGAGPDVEAQSVRPATIDGLMKDALTSWHVPGAALGIVQDGRVVFLKGFGVRENGKPELVTADTVFPIASCTKPFTTLALAILADEGKLDWDDPVRKHLNYFRLSDPLADANVTLRDLVSHRTGLDGHDLLWYRAPWGLEERIRKLSKLPLARSFRSGFQYQAILVGAAGLAAASASRTRWEDFVRQRILTPLDMRSTTVTTPAALKTADHASPHRRLLGDLDSESKINNQQSKILQVLPWYKIDEPDPAGSINSSARDLLQFLRLQLGDGTWQGKRVVSAANLKEMHRPQTIIRRQGMIRLMNPDSHFLSYGLGWVVQDYRGLLLLMHGGAIDGFRAHFTLVPEARLGFVLLNNLHDTQLNLAVSNSLVDLFLGLPARDWNAFFLELKKARETEMKAHKEALRKQRRPGTKPARALADYAGTYQDPAYGQARVSHEKGQLIAHWARFRWPLEHFHNDTFLANDDVLIDAPMVFILGPDGAVATLRALDRDFKRTRP